MQNIATHSWRMWTGDVVQQSPTSWAMAVRVVMSQICMRGLVGDSSITSFVLPGISAPRNALQITHVS